MEDIPFARSLWDLPGKGLNPLADPCLEAGILLTKESLECLLDLLVSMVLVRKGS
jgi:hypothetical protein